jgi:hypothetical protein
MIVHGGNSGKWYYWRLPMLELALMVVEAARALKLERQGGRSASAISDRMILAHAIDGLREALEIFDRETAQGLNAPGVQPRPDFATPPQLDEEGFIERQNQLHMQVEMKPPKAVSEPDFAPELEARPTQNDTSLVQSFAPRLSIPAATADTGLDYLNSIDVDMELNDGTESVADFLESLDAISDKLEHVVAKVGWTPRLRALAEAANVAKRKMFLDVAQDGYYIRIPAHSWSTLTVALADAVTDRDNNLTVPVPKPKNHELELEQRYGPRPPAFRP